MKLVGKLKDDVAKAKDPEEAKQLIEAAGMLLTDEELEDVAGGSRIPMEFDRKPIYDGNGNIIGYEKRW